MPQSKQFVRELFAKTIEAVELSARMTSEITLNDGYLHAGPDSLPLALFSRILVIAVGKAAVPMAAYMHRVLEPWREKQHQVEGIVVGTGPWKPIPGWTYFEGSHPLPDINSFSASELLLDRLRSADEKTLAIFLVSGGASSMLELPLSSTISQQDVIAFYRSLLHAGLPIAKMNVLRKHLSLVKGGRLAAVPAAGRQVPRQGAGLPGHGRQYSRSARRSRAASSLRGPPHLPDAPRVPALRRGPRPAPHPRGGLPAP